MALSLQSSLEQFGVKADIFYEAAMLRCLVPLGKKLRHKTSFHFRLGQKLLNFFNDRKVLKQLKEYDFVILSECIPNAYWRNYYALEELKEIVQKPLGIWEVYFLDSAPNHIEILSENGDHLHEVYDIHLALSKVSYQKTDTSDTKFELGLDLHGLGLGPYQKKDFQVVVDFESGVNAAVKEEQIKVLTKLGISFVELKGRYTIDEIRSIYKNASVFLLQKHEAFGMPIAECLAYGTKVFTPDSSWPLAFRLGDDIEYYGQGKLADCFQVYKNENELEMLLIEYRDRAAKTDVAGEVFQSFIENYPHFYYGNKDELARLITALKGTL